MFRMVFLIALVWLFIDLYFFQALSSSVQGFNPEVGEVIRWGYWGIEAFLFIACLVYGLSGRFASGSTRSTRWLMTAMTLALAPKLLLLPLLLLEDGGRLAVAGYRLFSGSAPVWVNRWVLLDQIAVILALIPLAGIAYGVTRGKYDFKVRRITLHFPHLPVAFDGFTITQLSDIHVGSFDSKSGVEKGIRLINEQQSDLILFTGDLVNNQAAEMEPWVEQFGQLKARYGQFAILGNHDYGDYISWTSAKVKEENHRQLLEMHKRIGFHLLQNEHLSLEKEGQHLYLIGVENWGLRGFHQYGDLNAASRGIPSSAFKILLSHDPSHWEAEILKHPAHIDLTLSGHTHGMQFGIEVPGFRWSPIQYVYKQWAGLYEKAGKYLYVNRGFGFLGFPGRVGIQPEITVFTLRKSTA